MRIAGDFNKPIDVISMNHRNLSTKFAHYSKVYPGPCEGYTNAREINTVDFYFDDIAEIDNLIFMLDRMKEQCLKEIGNWRPVGSHKYNAVNKDSILKPKKLLTPCDPCSVPGAPCEQCMFGYQDAETKHSIMKDLISQTLAGEKVPGYRVAERYMGMHPDYEECMKED